MLKKENRIGTKKEFEEVKRGGRLYQTPLFGCICLKTESGKSFGFIISKKISKKAVERNRIRRLLAEVIRKHLDEFLEGTRIIFLVKTAIVGKSFEEIEEEIRKISHL